MHTSDMIRALRASAKKLDTPELKGPWQERLDAVAAVFMVAAVSCLPITLFLAAWGGRTGAAVVMLAAYVIGLLGMLLMVVSIPMALVYAKFIETSGLDLRFRRLTHEAKVLADRFPQPHAWRRVRLLTAHWKESNVVWLGFTAFVAGTLLALSSLGAAPLARACMPAPTDGVSAWWHNLDTGACFIPTGVSALTVGAVLGVLSFYFTVRRSLRMLALTEFVDDVLDGRAGASPEAATDQARRHAASGSIPAPVGR